MPPDDTEKPRQEMDPNFKPLGPKLPEGWVCLQEGESLRRGEVGAAWNHRVEWFQFTCFEELRAVKGVAPLARKAPVATDPTPPQHGKTALLVGDGRKAIGHTIAAGPPASMHAVPEPPPNLGALLQSLGALSAGAPWAWGLRFPAPKKQRPPNPEKQAAAAAKRERRARRNKEGA